MTPTEIENRLAELSAAGASLRARPAADTLELLGQVLDGWSDPTSPWRRELEAKLPAATGFHEATVREGLARALEGWTGEALHALVERELGGAAHPTGRSGPRVQGFDTTAVLLAGSIPMPSLLALIAPLALGSGVLAKPASRDPITAPLVARSIAEVDALLGRCIAVLPFPGDDERCVRAALQADCVMAFGSDATLAEVASRLPAGRRLVPHAHRLSVAVLEKTATDGEALADAARGLALDIALWDQLGCLSPIAVYVVSGDGGADERAARALADALDELGDRIPRGAVDAAAAGIIAQERGAAELREASGDGTFVLSSRDASYSVVRERDTRIRPTPLHRFVRVHRVEGPEALTHALAPLRRHLAAVALAGSGAGADALVRCLTSVGASRICAPGAMQSPPLGWHHDGAPVLTPLARFSDLERP